MTISRTALALGVLAWGCGRPPGPADSSARCPASWAEQASADSLVALCLPTTFGPGSSQLGGAYTWKRPAQTPGDSDWVAVVIVGDSTRHAMWPPPLASSPDCITDCYTVDSAAVHADTIGSIPVRLETGLVTGGDERAGRAPRLVGGWITPRRTRILLVGAAERPGTLDTLRAALRTLRTGVP